MLEIPLELNLKYISEHQPPFKFTIVKGNLIKQHVDAIVNPTDEILSGGGGLDAIIHQAAGTELREECNKLQNCNTGDAKITPGFELATKYIIHAVGPVYQDGKHHEPELLAHCYKSILQLARDNNLTSIAIPAISTGIFQYPHEEAARVVYEAVLQDLKENGQGSLQEIRFVLWKQEMFDIYKRVFSPSFHKA